MGAGWRPAARDPRDGRVRAGADALCGAGPAAHRLSRAATAPRLAVSAGGAGHRPRHRAPACVVIPAVPYLQALGLEKEEWCRRSGVFLVSTIALAASGRGRRHARRAWDRVLARMLPRWPAGAGQRLRFARETQRFKTLFHAGLLALGAYLSWRLSLRTHHALALPRTPLRQDRREIGDRRAPGCCRRDGRHSTSRPRARGGRRRDGADRQHARREAADAELVVAPRRAGTATSPRRSDIAQALEALSLVAERSAQADKWQQGLQAAEGRAHCYSHLAGGWAGLFEGLLARARSRRRTVISC